MAATVQHFIDQLTPKHRVVIIGGVAVIGHGLSRHTKDADVWLEPMPSAVEWAKAVEEVSKQIAGTSIHRLPGWVEVSGDEIVQAVEETGMIRVHGLEEPLDLFRKPNEFKEENFDEVAARSTVNKDKTLLPDPLDLAQSKADTGREKDFQDILFLESVVRADYKARLPTASPDEAKALLTRYSEWQVLKAALENPRDEVQALARQQLKEFADAGDPFSQAILEGRETP